MWLWSQFKVKTCDWRSPLDKLNAMFVPAADSGQISTLTKYKCVSKKGLNVDEIFLSEGVTVKWVQGSVGRVSFQVLKQGQQHSWVNIRRSMETSIKSISKFNQAAWSLRTHPGTSILHDSRPVGERSLVLLLTKALKHGVLQSLKLKHSSNVSKVNHIGHTFLNVTQTGVCPLRADGKNTCWCVSAECEHDNKVMLMLKWLLDSLIVRSTERAFMIIVESGSGQPCATKSQQCARVLFQLASGGHFTHEFLACYLMECESARRVFGWNENLQTICSWWCMAGPPLD